MNKVFKRLSGLVIALVVLCSGLSAVQASANVGAAVMDTRTLAMVNKPGVVLVQTMWTADLTLNEFAFDSTLEDDLSAEITNMINNGSIENTDQAIYSAMVQLMIDNMYYYAYATGNVYTEQASTAAVGTGFIVTPDGYLVTNAHVVETNEDELYYNFAVTSLEDYAIDGANSFAEEMRRSGYEMTQEEMDGLTYAYYDLLTYYMSIDNLQTSYECYLGNVTPGSDVSAKGMGLDLRKIGEAIPGKDVAILKLDGTNLPTVTLGDDTALRTGDSVYAMGYPAVATLTDALNVAQAIQEPTLTSGIISARKEMADGWSILQTDAAIHGGNSGGPLFNTAGEVIGINTFGMLDPNSGAMVAGMNFAIPIGIAKQFLNEMNVTPSESQFTTQYKQALTYYNQQEYNKALEILRGLNETNPGYPVVADLLAECRTLSDQQGTSGDNAVSNSSLPGWIIPAAIGLGVILLILVIVVVLLLAKKGKKAEPAPAAIGAAPTPAAAVRWAQAPVPPVSAPPPAASVNHCSNCSTSLAANAVFCSSCGQAVPKKQEPPVCPTCGAPVQPEAKFCKGCGGKLNGGPTE